MSEDGYLRVGCKNHGIIDTEIRDEEKAKKIREEHVEENDCFDSEVQIQDLGFYDHSKRKPDDGSAEEAEERLNEILGEGENR
ncbi:hypothetical protein [Halorarum halobium]|uniref:hypothetical protein n=1 Tax=Halorarum halobium TaxID=3075121 RepID=UPI0028ABF71A|nr:hypothetical protein [Halobaculum sp. XH14]